MLNKKYKIISIMLFSSLCLSACGNKVSDEEKALADFSVSVSDFSDYIKEADQKINSLDTNNKESVDELLAILDDMDNRFAEFSNIDIPIQYQAVEKLADTASKKMSNAAAGYHLAYEAEEFDKLEADKAYQDYEFSMEMIYCIGHFLSTGEIPKNDHITIYEESNDSHILDRWLSDDDENKTASEATTEAVN